MLQVAAVAPHNTDELQTDTTDTAAGQEQALTVETKKEQDRAGRVTSPK